MARPDRAALAGGDIVNAYLQQVSDDVVTILETK